MARYINTGGYSPKISNDERKALYETAWQKPIRETAKELGISDVALKKRFTKLGIPTPGVGYWAKIAANKSVLPQPELPEIDRELSEHVYGYAILWKHMDELSDDELLASGDFHLLESHSVDIIRAYTEDLEIEGQLRNPTQWTSGLMREAEESREKERKEEQERKRSYYSFYFGEPAKVMHFPFSVSRDNEKRVLRILDTLDKTLFRIESTIREGERFWTNGTNTRSLHVYLLGYAFHLVITEKESALSFKFSSYRDEPAITTCVDRGDDTVENQLGTTILELCKHVDKEVGKSEFEHREWKREEEEKRKLREIEKRKDLELERRYQLLQMVEAWDKAERLRDFAETMKNHREGITDSIQRKTLEKISKWSVQEADKIDPFIKSDFVGQYLEKSTIWDLAEALAEDESVPPF